MAFRKFFIYNLLIWSTLCFFFGLAQNLQKIWDPWQRSVLTPRKNDNNYNPVNPWPAIYKSHYNHNNAGLNSDSTTNNYPFSDTRFQNFYNRFSINTKSSPTFQSNNHLKPWITSTSPFLNRATFMGLATNNQRYIKNFPQTPDTYTPPATSSSIISRRKFSNNNSSISELLKNVDWEENNLETVDSRESNYKPPCNSPNCQTWITISIPETSQVVYPGPVVELKRSKSLRGKPPNFPEEVSLSRGSILPPINPLPSIPFRPPPSLPKNRIPQTTTISTTSIEPPTTRKYPPNFVFSTSWILPVRIFTTSPTPIIEPSSLPDGKILPENGGENTVNLSTFGPPPPHIHLTTPEPTTLPPTNGGAAVWIKPFTLQPRPEVPGIEPSPPLLPNGGIIVAETGIPKNMRPKPWTHLSIDKNGVSTKNRPQPPTRETSIEQAAIWASTELIDAIRQALEKFRAILTRQNKNSTMPAFNPEENAFEMGNQLQETWDELKKGDWFEKALVELADSNISETTDVFDSSVKLAKYAAQLGLDKFALDGVGDEYKQALTSLINSAIDNKMS